MSPYFREISVSPLSLKITSLLQSKHGALSLDQLVSVYHVTPSIIPIDSINIRARSQYWIMLGRLGFSLFQLKLSTIYTDNFCLVSLSYVERDNKKRKQKMFPFDFFVIDHFVANFDQKMLEKRDIKKNIFSMALGRTYAWISIFFSATDTFRIN